MKIVKSIRIKYFRSILSTTRGNVVSLNLDHINVFVGQNDAGKSNIIRALNLFFNNECEIGEKFNFDRDFSIQKRGIKGEVSRVEIELTISPPLKQNLKNNGEIVWKKTWYPYSNFPKEEFRYVNGKQFPDSGKSGIYKWLKKIKFRYVPAIKSKEYFNKLMFDLYELFENDTNALEKSFNDQIKSKTSNITKELSERLNISSVLQFKGSFRELFNMLEFGSEDGTIMLNSRGDGIKIGHIPIVLQNMAELELIRKKNRDPFASTIIAFEEPENNLEFKHEKNLADTFLKYANRIHYRDEKEHYNDEGIQIFITTHSPVFYTLNEKNNVNCFYVSKKEDNGSEIKPIPKDTKGKEEIEREMDLEPLVKLSSSWKKMNELSEKISEEYKKIKQEYSEHLKPVLITEGKTDVKILEVAWSKLYGDCDRPFDIISANTYNDDDINNLNAGSGVLEHFIKSVRANDKITIALWDNDKEGINKFKLDKNFEECPGKKFLKINKNKKAFAMILPPVSDRVNYAKAENLAIEFYFETDEIEMKNKDGFGIKLENRVICQSIGEFKEEFVLEKKEYKLITGSKNVFASEIVPNLPVHSFNRFKTLFETISEDILKIKY